MARVKELVAAGAGPDQPVTTAGGRGRRGRGGETALVGAITAAVADNTAVLAALLAAAPTLDQAAKGEALLAAAKYGRADYMRTPPPLPAHRVSCLSPACVVPCVSCHTCRVCRVVCWVVIGRDAAGGRCGSERARGGLRQHAAHVGRPAVRHHSDSRRRASTWPACEWLSTDSTICLTD